MSTSLATTSTPDAVEQLCRRMTSWDPGTVPRIETINARLDQLRGMVLVLRTMGQLTDALSSRLQAAAQDLVVQRQGLIRASLTRLADDSDPDMGGPPY